MRNQRLFLVRHISSLLSLFFSGEKKSRKKQREKKSLTKNINLKNGETFLSLSINPGVDKGPQPLMFNPALTTCASERMKTQRFSYFADFAARERMREAKPVKLKKVAFSHFFDTLRQTGYCLLYTSDAADE